MTAGSGQPTSGLYTFKVANIQVVRIEKRRQLRAALQAHLEGRTRPAEARDRAELKPVVVLVDNLAAAREAIKAAKAIKGRGAPATIEYVEFLFAGPPPFESPDAWPSDRIDEWLDANIQWVRKCAGPRAEIAGAYYHTDERSPHLDVLLVPINDTGRLSWKTVEKGFALNPKLTSKLILGSMQDRYHEEVGRRFGLARGEVGSRRTHEPPDRRKGLVDRFLDDPEKCSAREYAEAALLRAEDADRERDRAVQRQREAEAERDRAVDAATSAEAERARAIEERDQAVARATATEAERDELKRSRSSVLRERDEARKARHTARQALDRERAARKAETADWKGKLESAARQLDIAHQGLQKAKDEVGRLHAQRPPTQIAVDQARAQAQVANTARERAESGRDKATEDWNRAYESYLAEKQQCDATTAKRDQDIAAARKRGHKQGQDSRDIEVKAAVDRIAKSQVELDALRERLPADIQAARQEGVADGRAERDDEVTALQRRVERLTAEPDDEVTALQQTIELLTRDLDAANRDRTRLVGNVKTLSGHRDRLQKRLTEMQPNIVAPLRPRRPGQYRPEQDRSRSRSTPNRN